VPQVNVRRFAHSPTPTLTGRIIQTDINDDRRAGRYERGEERAGNRNGSYEQPPTRVGSLHLDLRGREETIRTDLLQRYRLSENALSTTHMQMVITGVSTCRDKDSTTEGYERESSREAVALFYSPATST
jgi:transposase-like protein